MVNTKKVRALVLFSGGLDSMLAARLLIEQGISVTALAFESNFFDSKKAKQAAGAMDIPIRIADIREELLELVKNPPSGYGKNLNPCLDCHALMIREAGKIAKKEKYDLVATGEVLGQRPFSQTRQALNRVAVLAGREVLRPLSARLLTETDAEKRGLVIRHHLLDLEGRSRKKQLALAKRFGLTGYATPAGGCLLTDRGLAERLLKLINHWPDCDANDVKLVKHGRIYWLTLNHGRKISKALIIIGRNEREDKVLKKLKTKNDMIVEVREVPGPTALIRLPKISWREKDGEVTVKVPLKLTAKYLDLTEEIKKDQLVEIAARLTAYHAPKLRGKDITLTFVV